MSDFLARMGELSARRAASARRRRPLATLLATLPTLPAAPPLGTHGGFDLIAEVKRRSPSKGVLVADRGAPEARVATRAGAYADGGAAAISVLSEPTRFAGALRHVAKAASACSAPILRKDFLVDPYQLFEARAAGAGGALLIVAMLPGAQLAEMVAAGREAGLFLLLEAFDADELARAADFATPAATLVNDAAAAAPPPVLLGVNCRDLRSLAVDPTAHARLATALPTDAVVVAESGLHHDADFAAVARLGYRMALAGEVLMGSHAPRARVAAILAAGRAAAAGR